MSNTFVVRIILVGLIAYVPSEDQSEVTALLVKALEPKTLSNGCKAPIHRPMVVFYAGKCDGDCLRIDLKNLMVSDRIKEVLIQDVDKLLMEGGKLGSPKGLWILLGDQAREELSLKVTSMGSKSSPSAKILQGLRQTVSGKLRPFPLRTDPCEVEDFSWIAHGSEIIPPAGQVDRDCLGSASSCPVIARVALDEGTVGTCALNQNFDDDDDPDNDRVHSWEFRSLISPLVSRYTQALAEAVSVELEVSGEYVEFEAYDFDAADDDKKKASVKLEPTAGGTVDIVVINSPVENDKKLEGATCAGGPTYIDRHFELFYDLAAVNIPMNQRPVPHMLSESRAASMVQPRACLGAPRPGRPFCEHRVEELLRLLFTIPFNRPECDSFAFDPTSE